MAVVATAYGGPEVLRLTGIEVEAPGAGEVEIEVRSAGVNPADLKRYQGTFGNDPARLPLRLGFEASGRVTRVGRDATGPRGPVRPGDDVIAYRVDGAYAQRLVVPATAVVPKPDGMPWPAAGGLMLAGATATHLLTATGTGPGDTILVHAAAGGVGLMAVQLAVARGARVIGTARPDNHDLLLELGAEPVSYGPGLGDRVRALAPSGVSVALDLVGTDEALDTSVELVADRSRIASIVAFDRAGSLGIRLLGGGPGADPGTRIRDAARLDLVDLVAAGKLRVIVDRTFPLAEVAQAHRAVAGRHTRGKVILIP